MKLYQLESVGAVIDEQGMTYPMLVNGEPDWDQGVELTRISAIDWWENLSTRDQKTALDVWYATKKVWWEPLVRS